ncbi:transcription initiation factor IIB [Massospora cicadina]|nr:transcription initiation factor IIB [Massospora cicadina]
MRPNDSHHLKAFSGGSHLWRAALRNFFGVFTCLGRLVSLQLFFVLGVEPLFGVGARFLKLGFELGWLEWFLIPVPYANVSGRTALTLISKLVRWPICTVNVLCWGTRMNLNRDDLPPPGYEQPQPSRETSAPDFKGVSPSTPGKLDLKWVHLLFDPQERDYYLRTRIKYKLPPHIRNFCPRYLHIADPVTHEASRLPNSPNPKPLPRQFQEREVPGELPSRVQGVGHSDAGPPQGGDRANHPLDEPPQSSRRQPKLQLARTSTVANHSASSSEESGLLNSENAAAELEPKGAKVEVLDTFDPDESATRGVPKLEGCPTASRTKPPVQPKADEAHDPQPAAKEGAEGKQAQLDAELIEKYRREGLPDELALRADGTPINWPKLAIPEALWTKALALTEEMSQHRAIRQAQRRRLVVFAAALLILARQLKVPRTFAEVCNVTDTTKKEVGATFKLILGLQKEGGEGAEIAPTPHIDVVQLIYRWCKGLNLPDRVAQAAVELNREAHQRGITHTRCPTSACAASIWFLVSALNSYRESVLEEDPTALVPPHLSCSQQEVLCEGGVVLATLNGVMKLMLPHAETLLPRAKLIRLANSLAPESPPHHSAPVPSPLLEPTPPPAASQEASPVNFSD